MTSSCTIINCSNNNLYIQKCPYCLLDFCKKHWNKRYHSCTPVDKEKIIEEQESVINNLRNSITAINNDIRANSPCTSDLSQSYIEEQEKIDFDISKLENVKNEYDNKESDDDTDSYDDPNTKVDIANLVLVKSAYEKQIQELNQDFSIKMDKADRLIEKLSEQLGDNIKKNEEYKRELDRLTKLVEIPVKKKKKAAIKKWDNLSKGLSSINKPTH